MTVFAVLAHGDPSTFELTAEFLAPAQIVVHVDASSDDTAYPRSANISYVAERTDVRWGGFSMVRATEKLYGLALEKCASPNEYVVLLSGQCVPVRPMKDLDLLFSHEPGALYCRAGLLLDGNHVNERRILQRWFFDRFDARKRGAAGRAFALARRLAQIASGPRKRSDFEGLTMVAGSQWTALPAGVISSMLAETSLRNRLTELLRTALAPDEIYFHSLLYSGGWAAAADAPRPEPKGDRRTADFANLHFIDRSLTKYLSTDELRAIDAPGVYFARKVRAEDPGVLRKTLRGLLARDERR